jgi:hypothetical protein
MMRFTIIDQQDTISFIAPPHALKAITACCANGAEATGDILAGLAPYDAELSRRLRDQLAVFREHNTREDARWIAERLDEESGYEPVIAVIDEQTRRASLEPARLGLVVFNLPARRIVQVQNSYANLERSDRGRVRRKGKPVATFYSYTLPEDWSIVP